MASPNPNLHVAAGNSGAVTITSVATPKTLDVTSWTLTKSRDMAEVTHSGSGGWKQRKAAVRDWNATVELPWNSVDTPETVGFDIGAEVDVEFELADAALAYTGPAIVSSLAFKVDQVDVVRLTLSL